MSPTELKTIIDDLVAVPDSQLSLRIAKGRALHLVLCRVLEQQKQQTSDPQAAEEAA